MKTSIVSVLLFVLAAPIYGQDAIAALKEIVTLRQSILDREVALFEDNRRTSTDIIDLRHDLLNAKIDLASEQGDFHSVISNLLDIEELQSRKLKELKLLHERGSLDTNDVLEQQIQILKTQIRIAKARERATGAEQGADDQVPARAESKAE